MNTIGIAVFLESESLKYRIHRELSERIREGCEGRLNIRINPRWFSFGNVYPDCTHQRLMHMHEIDAAGNMVERMVDRFCKKNIGSGQRLSRWRSLRLGIVMHYICDFSCYVHTPEFKGTLRDHRAYEQMQSRYKDEARMRDICSFYGAESAADAYNQLFQTIRSRDDQSYSPSEDLNYALSIGTEMAYAMLRICMGETSRPPFRYRLPIIGRRLQRAAF